MLREHKSVMGRKKLRLAALAAMTGFAGFQTAANAQFVWSGGASPDNNWNTPNNWTAGSGFPGAGDSAQWNTGTSPGSSTVDVTSGAAASDLQVNDVSVTFNLNNFAFAVGGNPSNIDGDSAHATFNGPGTVSFEAPVQLGVNRPFSAGVVMHSRVTAQAGATVNTSGLVLGRYRGGGIATVDGAGTVWNNTRDVVFGMGLGDTGYIYTQPRAQLYVTNGAHFNHNLGANQYHTFRVANNNHTDSRIVVDGPGSQLNITGSYSYNFKVGGYNANSNWEFTNGGVLTSTVNLGLSFGGFGTGTNTYTITGANSKMTAPQIGLALRSSDSAAAAGNTVVNVGTGGTLEATSFDGSDRGITVGDRGRLSLQGGTVTIPATKDLALRDTGAATGSPATLEGNGTITGGNLRVEGDSIVRPGLSTGTLTLQNGSLTAVSAGAQFLFELSTTDASHDAIELSAAGQSASLAGVLSFSNIGAGSAASGILDFLLADTINYNTAAAPLSSGDVPLNTDNLDAILAAAGYTRVSTTPANANEYRYHIANDILGTLDALRLELGIAPTGPVVATWNVATAGDWHVAANWSGGVPDGIDHEANFLGAINATRTVFADSPATVGTMRFNNANTYHITGAASLTLEVSSGSALVDVQAGTHKINLPLVVASNTNLSVAGGAALKISDPVTVNANTSLSKSGAGTVTYESTVTLLGGATIAFDSSQHLAGLTVGDNATATMAAHGSRVLEADSLNISSTGGRVDLKDNKMIFRNQGPGTFTAGAYTGASGLVDSGRGSAGNAMWDGSGIVTSDTRAINNGDLVSIGVAQVSDVRAIASSATTTFAGQTVAGSDSIAMVTWGGDANLDGKINIDDYGRIDGNVGQSGSVFGWSKGDFNYDGKINIDDYGIIDGNINRQGTPFSTAGAVEGVAAVPEPASLSVLALGAVGLMRRRRRSGA